MLIKIPKAWQLSENQVTDETSYRARRQFITGIGALGLATAAKPALAGLFDNKPKIQVARDKLTFSKSDYQLPATPEQSAISYNNFYEFGTGKDDPALNAQQFKTKPWQVVISGEAEKTGAFNLEEMLSWFPLEERIYRLRCVEAWSMVIPWIGFPLASLLKRFQPTSKAKYVLFETLYDPEQMPGQKYPWIGGGISYPYREGLRIDEAMNPLTLMAVGMYGKTLPPQNGAPFRLVVPWKYGFKSIKSVVAIHFQEQLPQTTWALSAPQEYGFYANVNPKVHHPRWSQAKERVIGGGGLFNQKRIETQMFNGYGDEVAHLYQGMDLAQYF